jgi:hypothetical protein
MKLPKELLDKILVNLPFHTLILLGDDFNFIKSKVYNPQIHTFERAARRGDLDTIKWLDTNTSLICAKYAMHGAAYNGHLDVVKWLYHNTSGWCIEDAMDFAALNGHTTIIEFLNEMMYSN